MYYVLSTVYNYIVCCVYAYVYVHYILFAIHHVDCMFYIIYYIVYNLNMYNTKFTVHQALHRPYTI